MPATILTAPPSVSLTKEDIILRLATNQMQFAPGVLHLNLASGNGPAIDQTLTLNFGGRNLVFTFKGNPNNSGFQLPIPSGSVDLDYAVELAEAFRQQEFVDDQFVITAVEVTASTLWRVVFTSRDNEIFALTTATTATGVTLSYTAASSPYLQPNLSALVKLSINGGNPLKLTGSYALKPDDLLGWRGEATFNFKSLFDLSPHLPPDASINPLNPFGVEIATKAFARYSFRYADKYGTTDPVAERMFQSSDFYAIYGGRARDTNTAFQPTNGIYRCHPWQVTFLHNIDQLAYFYFFTQQARNGVQIKIRLYPSDATAPFVVDYLAPQNFAANTMYFFRTDPQSIGLQTLEQTFQKRFRDYRIELTLNSTVLIHHGYVFENIPGCKSLQIAYDNGLGGIDTFWFGEKWQSTAEAESTAVTYSESNTEGTFDALQRRRFEVETIPLDDIEMSRLRQMLTAKCWIVDTQASRFLPIVVDTKSIVLREQYGGLSVVKFAFLSAFKDATGA